MDDNTTASRANTIQALSDHHARELLTESAIDPEVVRERGYRSISRPSINDQRPRQELRALGIPSWAISEDYYFPGLLIPMYRATGERISCQFKPSRPVPARDGKRMKYASQKGRPNVLDVHPRWSRDRGLEDPSLIPVIRDVRTPLYITEGIKKADALTSRGLCTVALTGVYSWRTMLGSLGDWEDVPIRGREVTVVYDADARDNPNVLVAMQRIGRWLRSKGARRVLYLVTPAMCAGVTVKGADDFFAAGGALEQLLQCATANAPTGTINEDTFTDARLAEIIADDVLIGQYIHTSGLGWFEWTGQRWACVDDGSAIEAMRQYAITRYVEALEAERERVSLGEPSNRIEVDGWHKVQSAARLKAILSLAKNIAGVHRDAADFDTDPDILNTPSGVLQLATGELIPHDPDLLCTKITEVNYVVGAESQWFKTALEAIPDGVCDWLQVRFGQAATGHMPDDERMVLLTGGGSNGKTTLMNVLFDALGEYAAAVPNTLLLTGRSAGGATPEKMTIRGVRFAYIEETPEDRFLDTQALKEVVGTPAVTGRELYKGFVTFGATHSLFLNTNHPPRVAETDSGTWRRLLRVDFDKTYVLPGKENETRGTNLRPGVPGLKAHLQGREAKEAALAWLVTGAQAWYAAGRVLPGEDPPRVLDATKWWRHESDVILRFLDTQMMFDQDSWVATQGLYEHFREWSRSNGHRDMPSNLFLERVKHHTGLPAYVEVRRIRWASLGAQESVRPFGRATVAQQVVAVLGLRYSE